MNEQKLISVVIPTCHRNDFLAKCLDCLAPGKQTLELAQYEVIVTDDGRRSTAQEMMVQNYPWAKWVAGPKQGPAANRNHGASFASGEWIVFTDDDCLPKPAWLESYVAAIGEADVYEGKTTCEAGFNFPYETSPINLTGGYLWSCNMMIRRSTFLEFGGFDTGFPMPCNEDVELRERLKRAGKKMPFVPEAVVDHPPRPNLKGVSLAKRAESEVRLYYALGAKKNMGMRLLWRILDIRLHEMKKIGKIGPVLFWMGCSTIELAYIATHMRGWDKTHRNAYRRVDLAP